MEPTIQVTIGQIKELINEFRKPSEAEAKKLAAEEAMQKKLQQEKIELVKLEEEQKKRREANCGHMKPNGETTVMGQIHSDGMRHRICFRCQKEFPPQKVSMDEMVLG